MAPKVSSPPSNAPQIGSPLLEPRLAGLSGLRPFVKDILGMPKAA